MAVAASESGLIAAGGVGGAVIANPAAGEAVPIPGVANAASIAFARNGELLVVFERNGAVHLWDVASGEPVGQIWAGTGPVMTSQPWFDAEQGTVWVATEGRLLELSLDPQRWIERACAFVGRDVTPQEWDRYVPGNDSHRSVCP